MTGRVWTESDLDTMSWHDNHVHALRLVEGEHGAGQLVLDLDFITEWVSGAGGACRFRIMPATLAFREVTGLRVTLDYVAPSASLGPFSIDAIESHARQRERYQARVWAILVNWPKGEITFESPGFEQRGWGEERLYDQQVLPADLRL